MSTLPKALLDAPVMGKACLLSAVRFAAVRPRLVGDLGVARGLAGEPKTNLGPAGEAVAVRLPLRFDED